MSDVVVLALTLLAVLGCGLGAGIFFAFSSFVMKALSQLPPSEGIAAMQSINVAVLNPWFFSAFFGTAAVCVLTLIAALLRWDGPMAFYLLPSSALLSDRHGRGNHRVERAPERGAGIPGADGSEQCPQTGPTMSRVGAPGTTSARWRRSLRRRRTASRSGISRPCSGRGQPHGSAAQPHNRDVAA